MDDFSISEDTIVTNTHTARTLRRADVVFLLDCTGTMKTILRAITSAITEVVEVGPLVLVLGDVRRLQRAPEASGALGDLEAHVVVAQEDLVPLVIRVLD